jgi:hypothetical protein
VIGCSQKRHKISKFLSLYIYISLICINIYAYKKAQNLKSPQESPRYKNLQILLNTKVFKKVLNTKISKVLCIQGTKHQKSSLNTLYSPQYKNLQIVLNTKVFKKVLNTKIFKKVLNTKISKVLCIQGTKHQKSSLNTLYSPQYKNLQILLNTKVLKKVLNTKISKVLCIQGTKSEKSSVWCFYIGNVLCHLSLRIFEFLAGADCGAGAATQR